MVRVTRLLLDIVDITVVYGLGLRKRFAPLGRRLIRKSLGKRVIVISSGANCLLVSP